jgi:ATP-dependent Clp protease ATP-binding subunit ClpX
MEEVLLPVMYEVPSKIEIGKVLVTPEVITSKAAPTYLERGPNSVKRSNKRGEEKTA